MSRFLLQSVGILLVAGPVGFLLVVTLGTARRLGAGRMGPLPSFLPLFVRRGHPPRRCCRGIGCRGVCDGYLGRRFVLTVAFVGSTLCSVSWLCLAGAALFMSRGIQTKGPSAL
jgi:hypothetical protein